ncbi:hypothetical protein [Oceanibaculum sp.]|uniref:hypothetical protein n=1 Tax=Oceanibaculum sp. TaxID=1903597 RepID=UPI0025850DFC|nr:hypothetical protein [Oceanibaculum sp.]MCH2394346.1 hypothetical protein [Oceanibaculum sp.]
MTIHAFTSFSYSYLNRARVLAATLRRQHPDWVLWAVLTDRAPEGFAIDWQREEFDRVLTAEELLGDTAGQWLFGHDVIEACTGVKAAAMQWIMQSDTCTKLFYFDPDIAVLNPVTEIADLLDSHSIVLTPHQIDPEPRARRGAIMDNEMASLRHGAFNLGFLAVRNDQEGRRFVDWWADRLQDWCHDRQDMGVFVDQKWCDLVPCFFDRVKILRDPGCNVASWNISQRRLSFDDQGMARVNGQPLRFFHFTKLGAVGDAMTQRYAGDNIEVYELWLWYRNQIEKATSPEIPNRYWYYDSFDNGVPVPKQARVLYRERSDLRAAFPDPWKAEGGYFEWLCRETDFMAGMAGISGKPA